MNIKFDNSYIKLPEHFFTRMPPTPVSSPHLIRINDDLCTSLNIDPHWLKSQDGIEFIAGNAIPEGAEPIATVYAGHQFGNWNPQLGDGRAILMGEVIDRENNRFDIQLKGSGPTPYSRGGDGRAPLGPILREYIVSEAMFALGVPTSRSLGAVTTGDQVYREEALPGAVIARVAQSHIRIGSFQFLASKQDIDGLRQLTQHVIERHYKQALDNENPVVAMFEMVMQKQANLVAHWQSLGFIHGVMNTDNILLCGETIDYGPCAFMDDFSTNKVFSSIDQHGRYAYNNQPGIMHWNLSALAQALLPLFDEDQERALQLAQDSVNRFPALADQAYLEKMTAKLGLTQAEPDDLKLVQALLDIMANSSSDFTLTFRSLAKQLNPEAQAGPVMPDNFELGTSFKPWLTRWHERLKSENVDQKTLQQRLLSANPIFIPRNHIIEEVIISATLQQDFDPFHRLVDLLTEPFDFKKEYARYALPPEPEQVVLNTFCGT